MGLVSFQVSEASISHSVNGSHQSFTVSESDTLKVFFCPACQTVSFQSLPSGMTCALCTSRSDQSTSSMEDFPVRTSVAQDLEQAWRESEADFSSRLSDSQKKLVRSLCSSKTSQQLELEDFERSSEHLPIFGMTVGGLVFLPLKLEPRTLGKDGSYLPTPAANSYGTNQGGAAGRTGKVRASLETMARKNLWPTPRASDGEKNLRSAAGTAGAAKEAARKGGPQDLISAVRLWPTPTASDSKNVIRKHDNYQSLVKTVGGALNPTWVEWLMGYPPEWTVCADWVIQSFLRRPKKHLKD
jgi:hypothetical protein